MNGSWEYGRWLEEYRSWGRAATIRPLEGVHQSSPGVSSLWSFTSLCRREPDALQAFPETGLCQHWSFCPSPQGSGRLSALRWELLCTWEAGSCPEPSREGGLTVWRQPGLMQKTALHSPEHSCFYPKVWWEWFPLVTSLLLLRHHSWNKLSSLFLKHCFGSKAKSLCMLRG